MYRAKTKGFTLVELMMAVSIGAIVFGAIVCALASFQKCFLATDQYSQATSDEQRVMDYICRDLRSAYTAVLSANNQTLTVTLPDYYGGSYDAQGNPTVAPVTPAITNGVVNYGDPTKPLTVCYYLSGQRLIRQQAVAISGSTTQVVISSNVENLQTTFIDLTSTVQATITFMPTFLSTSGTSRNGATETAGTSITANVAVRNVRRD